MHKGLFVFDPSVEPSELASFCLETGVDALILSPAFFEDDRFLDVCRCNGIRIWLNFPVFFDEKYLRLNPEAYSITSRGNQAVHSWLHMACPSHQKFFERKREELSTLLRKIHPDCLSYDFIRFYVFWEEVELFDSPDTIEHGCYCTECRSRFARFSGEQLSIQDGTVKKGQRKVLGQWKRSVVEDAVRSLNAVVEEIAKGTPTYIKTVPWQTSDLENALHWIVGQDPAALGRMSDGIIPMAFTQILGQTPNWKTALLDHVKAESGKDVMSYIQFEPLVRAGVITEEQLDQELAAAIAEKRAGLVYFHYEQIAKNAAKQRILKRYCKR